jgi:hypothetical protein
MIHVRRTAEHPTLVFEVVVREGKGETRHHVTIRDARTANRGQAYAGALSGGGFPVFTRP